MTADPWLLPTRQRELPFRETLSPSRLHARREGTFLVLAGTFLLATAAMLLLPARSIDVAGLGDAWFGLDLPIDLQIVLGAQAFPITLVMLALVGRLYGTRRALALVAFGSIACLGLGAVAYAVDPQALGFTVAFTAGYLAMHVVALLVCAAMWRKSLALGANVAALVAQLVGWAAFGLVLYLYGSHAFDQITSIVLGGAAMTTAGMLVATMPLAIAGHVLGIYLRVGRGAPKRAVVEEPDDDDDDEVVDLVVPKPRAPEPVAEPLFAKGSHRTPPAQPRSLKGWHPDTSAEMRFFTEGDQLDESNPELPAARA
jgi:hypothetical protein